MGANIEHLDWALVERYTERVNPAFLKETNRIRVLRELGLLSPIPIEDGDSLHKAAVLCFSRQPELFFPQAYSILIVGNVSTDEWRRTLVQGPLSAQIERLVDLTMRNLETLTSFGLDPRRGDRTEIPYEVIRETISNAVIHRDYNTSGVVQVRITSDEVQVLNPGKFPGDLSWDSLLIQNPPRSLPSDPAIPLYLMHLGAFEGVGRGFSVFRDYLSEKGKDKIICDCLPDPSTICVRIKRPAPHRFSFRKIPSGIRWMLIALVILTLVFAGWDFYRREKANMLANTARTDLKNFKTDSVINAQDGSLDAIVERAEQALEIARTAETVGLYALTRVLQQKWHYAGWKVGWSESRFREGERITNEALQVKRTPEALLARGLLASGACRKMPDWREEERLARCEEARKLLDEALVGIADDLYRGWLEVEIQWAAVMTVEAIGGHLEESGDIPAAHRIREAAFNRCIAIWPKLDSAPVNGRELVEDCLIVAGALQEYRIYLEWSSWLIDNDLRIYNRVMQFTKQHIVRAVDRKCNDIRFDREGAPVSDPSADGDITDLCRYLGLISLGCPDRAKEFRSAQQPGVPWRQVEAAARRPVRTECALD